MKTMTKESVNRFADAVLTGLLGGVAVTVIAMAVIFYS